MLEAEALIGIATVLALGAASPGPSFVMVARTAVAASRGHGLYAALGMGVGGLLFAIAALLGLQGLFLAVPALYIVLKVAGGLYLAYLGIRIWRGAKLPLNVDVSGASVSIASHRSFVVGFATQVSNPKTAIVYASVFAAFLPADPSLEFCTAIAALVLGIETSWYALVATLLSANRPRRTYVRYKAAVDRVAGAAMIALGLKLVSSARN